MIHLLLGMRREMNNKKNKYGQSNFHDRLILKYEHFAGLPRSTADIDHNGNGEFHFILDFGFPVYWLL